LLIAVIVAIILLLLAKMDGDVI